MADAEIETPMTKKMKCPYKDCRYTWQPRVAAPKKCPHCTRPLVKRPAA